MHSPFISHRHSATLKAFSATHVLHDSVSEDKDTNAADVQGIKEKATCTRNRA